MSVDAGAISENRLIVGNRLKVGLSYLDVAIVAIATAPALALGAPALGFGLGAGAWVVQRLIGWLDQRWVGKVGSPVRRMGVTLFESFGRIWLLAIAIVIAGAAGSRADGLTAAVVIMAAYTIAFAIRILTRPRRSRGAA